MAKSGWQWFFSLGLALVLLVAWGRSLLPVALPAASSVAGPAASPIGVPASPLRDLRYQTEALPNSVVHTLLIPAQSQFEVAVMAAAGLEPIEQLAESAGAIAALNAGFFDPVNQLTTSYVVQEGALVADPRQNDRLMQNPDLTDKLDLILDRSEFRCYRCGQTGPAGQTGQAIGYEIARHSQALPPGCTLLDAVGAGPRLLPSLDLVAEGFREVDASGTILRDALGSDSPNARTAIGITRDGDLLWAVAAQLPDAPTTSGLTLAEMATFLRDRNVVAALNLDGGSSSALYYAPLSDAPQVIYGKRDSSGNPVKRSIKSALVVRSAG